MYQAEESGADVVLISLELHSDYKGLAEVVYLQKQIRGILESHSHEQDDFIYAFKEVSPLTFKVKRFQRGE